MREAHSEVGSRVAVGELVTDSIQRHNSRERFENFKNKMDP
jgi:hypothetical protein